MLWAPSNGMLWRSWGHGDWGGHVLYIDIGQNLTRQHLYFSPVQTTGVYKYILKLISFQSGRRILASLLGYQSTLIVCFCFYFVLVKVCMQQFHILIGVVCFPKLMGSFYMGCIWHWTDGISLKDKRWFSLSMILFVLSIRDNWHQAWRYAFTSLKQTESF